MTMEGPERLVCCSLCLCMAVAVFSSVALVYLTALVYMPAKREIASGLSDVPVMCTTIERVETDDCDWYSCGEWCLSKSSNCVKLWAQVRKNGTDILLNGCRGVQDITCMVLDDDFVETKSCSHDSECVSLNRRFFAKCGDYDCGESTNPMVNPFRCDAAAHRCVSARQYRNCKEDRACTNLQQLHLCDRGLCQNVTSVFDCNYERTEEPLNCKDKRNCISLHGLFDCKDGLCRKLLWPWHCERRCPSISMTTRPNVILLSGDKMLGADCQEAMDAGGSSGGGPTLWSAAQSGPDLVLMTSCTEVTRHGSQISAKDCVNGTLMPRPRLPASEVNYTTLSNVFHDSGRRFPLDRNVGKIPFDTDITIYNKTKLLINTEACVNTLQYECTEFYLDHRRDGRNYSRRDRFPCYYTPRHGDFVTTRFSLARTRHVFLICFSVPACLWILSCSCLFACSKTLRVEDNGQMRIRCRKRLSTKTDVSAFTHSSRRKRTSAVKTA